MAYRRTRPRTTRKRTTRKGYGGARRRRPASTIRRRRSTRPMSRKRILDMTSNKKRDTMLSLSNVTVNDPSGGTTFNYTGAILTGDETYCFPWVATARNQFAPQWAQPTRSSSACYMRGLKESIQIQTNNGRPWQWRRICLTLKNAPLYQTNQPDLRYFDNGVSGCHRVVNNIIGLSPENLLMDYVFRGSREVDWQDVMNASVDTARVTLHYDKTRRIASGNQYGMMRCYKMWHAMNKTLNYDDSEDGGIMTPSAFSVGDKRGMGDFLILDFIRAGSGAEEGDQMIFHPNATLYWHEK
ncbi:capsid protein [Plant associated genomovirus 16]|nr:capsid protein [Plant associated genomovirus 16]